MSTDFIMNSLVFYQLFLQSMEYTEDFVKNYQMMTELW